MKILLANSYFLERDSNELKIMKPYPPLGMLYVTAVLKGAGHSVDVFDGTFNTYKDFGEHLYRFKPDLVGIYANVITRDIALQMVKEAREKKVPVVLGGPDPSGDAGAYLAAGALAVIRGEGEHTMLDLTTRLEAENLETELKDLPGLILPGNGAPRATEARKRIEDLDTLPLPDRCALDMERYIDAWKKRHGYASLSLITSRGCPYHCTWCSKEVFGEVFRQRSPGSVIAEIRWLREQYNPEQFWFADDILTLNRKWILDLTDKMDEEGLVTPFECLSRVDRIDGEVVDGLRKAGCFRIWYGAESGSEKVVKNMRKDFTVAKVRESVAITKKAGIEVGLFILLGYPGERLLDLLKTCRMIKKLSAHYCGSSVAFPIKGTPFYTEVKHMLAPDYAWSRRNENRLSFQGRYPSLFYWFAVRLVHNWSTFWSCRKQDKTLFRQLLRAIKFSVAGLSVVAIGLGYDLKGLFSPAPHSKKKEQGAPSKP
jgi:radical SAM superfamily enzyme YgiQ (UPF0313 family)